MVLNSNTSSSSNSNRSNSTSLPSTICPITLEEMVDPVLAQDGYTYERSAIEEWIRMNGVSPNTRQPLSLHGLVPNRALKEMMEMRRQLMGGFGSTPPSSPVRRNGKDYSELYSTVLNATKAEYHTNALNAEETVVHIDLPKSSFIAERDHASNHICCVIDVSGSMAAEATCHDAQGLESHTGLSILEVVKYATEVIAQSLSKHDFLSIVTYSNDATVVLHPTNMTDQGKKIVTKKLSTIRPEFRTNLWAGIREGLKQAEKVKSASITSIFVLTDGLPNMDPPLGYERAMKSSLSQSPLYGSLSTFGFGKELDSPLLVKLAKLGGGTFSFIPDSGMVGTIFINALANARCSFGVQPMIKIKGGVSSHAIGATEMYCTTTNDEVCVHLSPLRYDTTLDIVLPNQMFGGGWLNRTPIDMELVFRIAGGKDVHIAVIQDTATDEIVDLFDSTRMSLVSTISKVTRSSEYDPSIRHSFTISDEAQNKRIDLLPLDSLCKDIEDQATLAISNESYYKNWGRHYLFSLHDAHLNQICNNFKDPGVQVYGNGERFLKLQEKLNETFDQVTPPKPKKVRGARMQPKRASMTTQFNNPDAVCVHGNTLLQVRRSNGGVITMPISNVKRGDYVQTESNDFVKVECVVQTTLDESDSFQLIRFGDLLITPYHPIKVDGTWHFPIDCPDTEQLHTDAKSVYNLVLEEQGRHQGVMMGGVCCSTLGHGLRDNATIEHAYFGTEKVVLDLQKIESYSTIGHVTLR